MRKHKLVGKRVRVLHNRGGASPFGVVKECRDPDTFLVQMDDESGWIPVSPDGMIAAPVEPKPEPEPESKPKRKTTPRSKESKPKPRPKPQPVAQPEPEVEPESVPEEPATEPRRQRFWLWRRKPVKEVEP